MAKSRILVVEDEPVVALDIRNRLETLGYAVSGCAASGEEALARVAQDQPDLVLMDVWLHGSRDGIETAQTIRRQFGLPVVFITACSDDETLARVKNSDSFGIIYKPFTVRDLYVAIEMALGKYHLERKLQDERNLLRTIIDVLPDSVYVKDLQSRFLIANQTVARRMGVKTPDELIGKTDFDFYPQEVAQQFFADEQQIIRSGQPLVNKEEPSVADGQARWLLTAKVPLCDRQGKVIGLVGTGRDITTRKKAQLAQQQMQQKIQEYEKLQSIGVLAGGIAHDFNNLLMDIQGNVDLALMKLPADAPAAGFLVNIHNACQRAVQWIRQLLAYAGRSAVPQTTLVDLAELIQEVLRTLAPAMGKKIRVVLDLADNLPRFHTDAAQIQQVLLNVITNAVEALSGREGEIRIASGQVQPDQSQPAEDDRGAPAAGQCCYIEVADTGCGMDAATQARMFEPFFTTKFTGRGLGLSAVSGIVRSHGGDIRVTSVPERGTTVRILLPCEPSAGAGGPANAGAPVPP